MARGKYKGRRTNRDNLVLSAEIESLTADIATTRTALAAAQQHAQIRDELKAKLAEHKAERDAAVADEQVRLTADIDILTALLRDARHARDELDDAWKDYLGNIVKRYGSSPETFDRIIGIIGGDPDGVITQWEESPTREKLGVTANLRIDQARGHRRTQPNKGRLRAHTLADAAPLAPSHLRLEWAQWMRSRTDQNIADPPPTDLADLLDAWLTAKVHTLTPVAAMAGHPSPYVDPRITPDHPVARLLGADLTGPPTASPRNQAPPIDPLLSDRAWYALRNPWAATEILLPHWRRGRDIIPTAGRIPTPMHPPSRHPAPADAVALRHWYALAAAGTWTRTDPDPTAPAYGEIAVALAAASIYWMPVGQVHGYLDSDPITADDRDRIRLAYPNVFLTLGKPIVLDPQPDIPTLDLDPLDRFTVNWLRHGDINNHQDWILAKPHAINHVTLTDLIAARGALIEGVILLADTDGTPNGRFAWCLAVPALYGVLGRWVIPANRDRTIYTDQLDALLAVAAWADWHQPPDVDTPTTTHQRSAALQRAAAAGHVHVLNAARTASASARSHPTGRTVTAHLRRGHWRRQPVGVGRSEIRMVRVAPAVVGAGSGARPLSTPIYRLPRIVDNATP